MAEPEEFIDALRSVIRASRIAELSRVELADSILSLRQLAGRLEAAAVTGERTQASLASWSGEGPSESFSDRILHHGPESVFPYSPYVGALNALAPPIALEAVPVHDRVELHGRHSFAAVYNGPPNGVHGGVIAGVMDELLGSLCVANELSGFTGTLTVRYEAITPVEQLVTLRSWVERVEGRKTIACGTIHHGQTLCARAEGIFISASTLGFG